MDRLVPHEDDFPAVGDPHTAVVLARTPRGNLHVGLLYRSHGKGKALHLGWEDLLYDSWMWGGLRTAPQIEPELSFVAARMCRKIWACFVHDRKFPYGLRLEGTSFDADGRLVLAPGTRGLSCATLVLAVFRSVGVELIDESDWPIRKNEDQEYLAFVRPFASESHYAALVCEVNEGVKRVRPEEATAACLLAPPATYTRVRPLAEDVVTRLDG